MKVYRTAECNCAFEVNLEEVERRGKSLDWYIKNQLIPPINLDINNISLECPLVWKMLGRGQTKGVFQLESSLGKQWTKKLKPTCIEHLAALGALLRPGCLRATDEKGISMTEHYCLRKNNLEEVDCYHPALEPILSKTYGVLTYQEQAMAIAQAVAGFNLQEADVLRKAIGKKLPEEMAKCKRMFLEGAEKVKILTKEQAEEVFSWIEKSQRYSFNKSHAVSYAIDGYWSAFCKAHFPVQFFTSYLYYAKDKQDPLREIQELVSDAKSMDIEIVTPDITKMKSHFSTDGRTIMFGLSDVKGIGEIQVEKLKKAALQAEVTYGKKLADLTWYEFLVLLSNKVSSAVIEKLISVGAMRSLKNANIEKRNVSGVQSLEQANGARTNLDNSELSEVCEHCDCNETSF